MHTIAWAAAVQVDLVVTPFFSESCAGREVSWHGTAQLQRHWVFITVKASMSLHIAMEQRAGGDHLGIDPRVARERAPKAPAVPVGPVHAGRRAEAPGAVEVAVRVQICHPVPPVGG